MGKLLTPAEHTLDGWFGKYIRLRDTPGPCVTCGRWLTYEDSECGHFITRDNHATRWDERNSHAQCPYCNGPRKGEQFKHGLRVEEIHGKGTCDILRWKASHSIGFKEWEIREMSKKFRLLYNELKKTKAAA